jgi:hypothetical protein
MSQPKHMSWDFLALLIVREQLCRVPKSSQTGDQVVRNRGRAVYLNTRDLSVNNLLQLAIAASAT